MLVNDGLELSNNTLELSRSTIDIAVRRQLVIPRDIKKGWLEELIKASVNSGLPYGNLEIRKPDSLGITLLSKRLLNQAISTAWIANDPNEATTKAVTDSVERASKPYSKFPIIGLPVHKDPVVIGSQASPSLAFRIDAPMIEDEMHSIDEHLWQDLGISIDRSRQLVGPYVTLLTMYNLDRDFPNRVLNVMENIRPTLVTAGPQRILTTANQI